jgi:hypothetical protein
MIIKTVKNTKTIRNLTKNINFKGKNSFTSHNVTYTKFDVSKGFTLQIRCFSLTKSLNIKVKQIC